MAPLTRLLTYFICQLLATSVALLLVTGRNEVVAAVGTIVVGLAVAVVFFGLTVAPRARVQWALLCFYVTTGWTLFVASGHSVFVAFFGPFVVGAAAGVMFLGVVVVAALIRAIKRRF